MSVRRFYKRRFCEKGVARQASGKKSGKNRFAKNEKLGCNEDHR